MSLELNWNGEPIRWERVAFRRRLSVTILPDASLRVRSGIGVRPGQIVDFLEAHRGWIARNRSRLRRHLERFPEVRLVAGERIPILGRLYSIAIEDAHGSARAWMRNDQLVLSGVDDQDSSIETRRKLVIDFFRSLAEPLFRQRLMVQAQRLRLRPRSLRVRHLRSRWGSCSLDGDITLNSRLVFAPLPVIDYVVIHELAHLVHHNHSRSFWGVVLEGDPKMREHRKWLRENQRAADFLIGRRA